jgi:flagellar biosynthesis anti-sigma factor FlgM
MKVYNIGKNGLEIPAKSAKSQRDAGKGSDQGTKSCQDRVCLSKDVLRLLEMAKQTRGTGQKDVRPEVVERVRREIQEGSYTPDSKEVAEKLIAQALGELPKE